MTKTPANRPADWKEFDDFAAGIATNRLPASKALIGKSLKLALDNGRRIRLEFPSLNQVRWQEGTKSATEVGEVIAVSETAYFIDFTYADRPNEDEIFIVDMASRQVLSVAERVRDAGEAPGEPRVAQVWTAAYLDDGGAVTGLKPAATRDLIGMTAHYEYSPNHLYEHIYLSSQRYAWQNLVGVQRGHGDVDMATTYKFAEGQYVFGFREFIIPVASLFFYNWKDMRSTGKFLGVTKSGAVENKPAGAHIIKKSKVIYDAGKEPV